MPLTTIRCQHCGDPAKTVRPDLRKFCDTCRAIRSIRALALSTQKCKLCRKQFYPVDQKHARARACTACSGTPSGEAHTGRVCVYCDTVTGLVPGLKLCYLCCETPADKRHASIVKSLTLAYESRAEAPLHNRDHSC